MEEGRVDKNFGRKQPSHANVKTQEGANLMHLPVWSVFLEEVPLSKTEYTMMVETSTCRPSINAARASGFVLIHGRSSVLVSIFTLPRLAN